MKRIIMVFLIISLLFCISACSGSTNNDRQTDHSIVLTPDNFNNYFYSKVIGPAIDIKKSVVGTTYFVNTVQLSFDLNQTASLKNVTVKGKVEINVEKTHLLYSEGIFPLDFSVNIGANGHGEAKLTYQHGTGSYGGYNPEDFYITIESVTGTVTPG